jgi:hypothetical protein
MKFLSIFLVVISGLMGQTLAPPLAGTVLDARGRIALFHGVQGNLLPPEYAALPAEIQGETILSAAFNANGGVLKTASHLVLLDSHLSLLSIQPAPKGKALFSFSSDGTPSWVLYVEDGELVNISSGASIPVGGVVALGPFSNSSVSLLTSVDTTLWAGTASVPAQIAIPGAAPAAFFERGWLSTSASGLIWSPAAGGAPAREIALPERVQGIQTAAVDAVVINGRWLLNARFQLLEIPGARRKAPRPEAVP